MCSSQIKQIEWKKKNLNITPESSEGKLPISQKEGLGEGLSWCRDKSEVANRICSFLLTIFFCCGNKKIK